MALSSNAHSLAQGAGQAHEVRHTDGVFHGVDFTSQFPFHMKSLHTIAWILVMVGAINWLLVGIGSLMGSDLNVVHMILGSMPMIEAIVYVLVGLSAVYEIVSHKKLCRQCGSGSSM
jgi:uncharacterized membrane protein YuzA (DUF378 family)